jgi:hypothetical protein
MKGTCNIVEMYRVFGGTSQKDPPPFLDEGSPTYPVSGYSAPGGISPI